jgi:hypothetical protein
MSAETADISYRRLAEARQVRRHSVTLAEAVRDGHETVIRHVPDGRELIDGRNRLRACEIAGVQPITQVLDGIDPVDWIISKNVNRRHQSKGARAIAVAKIFPDPEKQGRGRKGLISKSFPMIDAATLSQARTIFRHAPDLADQVLAGSHSFVEAYDKARVRKAEAETTEQKIAAIVAEAPDLAELAAQSLPGGRLDLTERGRDALRAMLAGMTMRGRTS